MKKSILRILMLLLAAMSIVSVGACSSTKAPEAVEGPVGSTHQAYSVYNYTPGKLGGGQCDTPTGDPICVDNGLMGDDWRVECTCPTKYLKPDPSGGMLPPPGGGGGGGPYHWGFCGFKNFAFGIQTRNTLTQRAGRMGIYANPITRQWELKTGYNPSKESPPFNDIQVGIHCVDVADGIDFVPPVDSAAMLGVDLQQPGAPSGVPYSIDSNPGLDPDYCVLNSIEGAISLPVGGPSASVRLRYPLSPRTRMEGVQPTCAACPMCPACTLTTGMNCIHAFSFNGGVQKVQYLKPSSGESYQTTPIAALQLPNPVVSEVMTAPTVDVNKVFCFISAVINYNKNDGIDLVSEGGRWKLRRLGASGTIAWASCIKRFN